MFSLTFDEIAPIVGRSSTATRQLASRARRRVQGKAFDTTESDLSRQRKIAEAFLAASREGNFNALLELLDPNVVLRADAVAAPPGGSEIFGAQTVARGATSFPERARFAELALVDGMVGIIVAPQGQLRMVLGLTMRNGKVTEVEIMANPERLHRLDIALLES
jgi:RNA polymerase sigma-70 factor (ECF subfamily)